MTGILLKSDNFLMTERSQDIAAITSTMSPTIRDKPVIQTTCLSRQYPDTIQYMLKQVVHEVRQPVSCLTGPMVGVSQGPENRKAKLP